MSFEQKKYLNNIKKNKIIVLISQVCIIISFLLSWEILTKMGIINSFIYSSPSNIIKTIINLYKENNLFIHIFITLKEVLLSFLIGILLAFFIAIIFYEIPIIAKIFDPFLTILNSLPKVALGPIIIIICGTNTKSIIVMAVLINLVVSIITIYDGFMNVDKVKLKLFRTFNASKKDTLFKLVIPQCYKTIISSLKLNISLTLIGVITGEFLVSKNGIGYLIIYGTQVFNLNLVMSGIFILLIISFVLYKLIIIFEKKILPF